MSSIVPITNTPANKRLVQSLLDDWNRAVAQASADHDEGRHVGLDGDDIAVSCGACMAGGDYPERHPLTRAELLERNIAEAVARMRLHADISAFENSMIA